MTDYVLPDGTRRCRSRSATTGSSPTRCSTPGTDSGSEYEYVDAGQPAALLRARRARATKSGELSYTVAVRSLDGAGPQRRGVRLLPAAGIPTGDGWATCRFPLHQHRQGRRGRAAPRGRGRVPEVGRLPPVRGREDAAAGRSGCRTRWRPPSSARTDLVTVYAKRESGSHLGRITLTATSESDPGKDDTATCLAVAR